MRNKGDTNEMVVKTETKNSNGKMWICCNGGFAMPLAEYDKMQEDDKMQEERAACGLPVAMMILTNPIEARH